MVDQAEIDALRQQVHQLRQEVELLRQHIDGLSVTPHASTDDPDPGPRHIAQPAHVATSTPTRVTSEAGSGSSRQFARRGLLLGGMGAAVGAAATVAGASPAAAGIGNMQYGALNLAGTSATTLNSANETAATLILQNTGGGGKPALDSYSLNGPGAVIGSGSEAASGLRVRHTGSGFGIELESSGKGMNIESASYGINVSTPDTGIYVGGPSEVTPLTGIQAIAEGTAVIGEGNEGGDFTGIERAGVVGRSRSGPGVEAESNFGAQLYLHPSQDRTGLPASGTWPMGSALLTTDGSLWWCAVGGSYNDAQQPDPQWRLLTSSASAGAFVPMSPARVFDSRYTPGTPGGPVGPLGAGTNRTIDVRNAYIPNSSTVEMIDVVPAGATAVALNLTITGPTAGGYVYLGPGDAQSVTASSINWSSAGATVANGLIAPFGATDRQLKAFAVSSAAGASVQVIVDVSGYYLGG